MLAGTHLFKQPLRLQAQKQISPVTNFRMFRGKLANATECNVDKTLVCYIMRKYFCLSQSDIFFHLQWWQFSNEINKSNQHYFTK